MSRHSKLRSLQSVQIYNSSVYYSPALSSHEQHTSNYNIEQNDMVICTISARQIDCENIVIMETNPSIIKQNGIYHVFHKCQEVGFFKDRKVAQFAYNLVESSDKIMTKYDVQHTIENLFLNKAKKASNALK